MSELSKQALKVENTESFPNNSAGLITPSDLRAFNENMIDSLVDEITYNEDSASWNQSIDALEQFTASQQPSFTALNEFTASQLVVNSGVNAFTQSADGRLDTLETEVDSLQAWTGSVNEISDDGIVQGYSTRLHFYGNVSASIVQNVGGPIASINIPLSDIDTGSLLTTASFDNGTRNLTFTKGDASQFSVNIPDVSGSSGNFATTGSNTFTGDQNIIGAVTASALRVENNTRLDGTLTVTNDTTMTGDLLIQSSSPKLRLRDTSGGGFSSGYDLTIDTGSFIINDETHDRPVLSDIYNPSTLKHTTELTSEIIVISGSDSVTIQGQLTASLQEGYAWVGNSSNVSTLVATSSFGGGGTINTGSFATTGSNTFIGDQTITGSVNVSELVTADIFSNPQTLTGTLTIPTDRNAMVVGTVAIDGSVVIEGDSKLVVIDQLTPPQTIDTGSFATTGSNTFTSEQTVNGDITILNVPASPRGFEVQTANGLQQYLKVGPRGGSSGNMGIYLTGSDVDGGGEQDLWGINKFGSVWQQNFSTDVSFLNNATFRDGILIAYQGGITEASARLGINHQSGSTEIYAGLNQNGRYIISSSANDRAIEINPASGFVEVYGQINFNSNAAARGPLQVRNVNTDLGFGYVAQFDTISGSNANISQALTLTPQDPLPSGNIGDLAVSGSSLYFYNGAWTFVV